MIWRARRRRFTAFPEAKGCRVWQVPGFRDTLMLAAVLNEWPGSYRESTPDQSYARFYVGPARDEHVVAEALLTGDTWELRIQPNIVP